MVESTHAYLKHNKNTLVSCKSYLEGEDIMTLNQEKHFFIKWNTSRSYSQHGCTTLRARNETYQQAPTQKEREPSGDLLVAA